jgi:uncharacterized GH25 family protein
MKSLLFCIFLVFSAQSQQEIWLQPSRFFPIIEEPIDISIYEGLNFQGKISPFSTEKYQNFKHFGPPAKKISDDNGQIKVKFTEEGTHIIAIEATQNTKKYTNSEFQNYVNEQGNSTISVKNMSQNISEIRNEYGKMLVQVGINNVENTNFETNQRLEIVPIENPFGNRTSISFKILFDKEPLSGVSLLHFTKTSSQTSMSGLHSDKNGIVNYPLSRGLHLLKVVYIIPSTDKSLADFETFIASLTFGKK